jgi:hypothetical protein
MSQVVFVTHGPAGSGAPRAENGARQLGRLTIPALDVDIRWYAR